MTIKLGIVMDDITTIKPEKDSSFAMLLEAQARNWEIYYIRLNDLFIEQNKAYANVYKISVQDKPTDFYQLHEAKTMPLGTLDIILMRKDPPVDNNYIYATHILELAQQQGARVVNNPQSLRDANEKLFTTWFPQCCPASLVSSHASQLKKFIEQHQEVILKPLDGMGGRSVFRIQADDDNQNVIIETLTNYGKNLVMAQKFIPEISEGDKRVLLINGKPFPYALARKPIAGEHRANLAAGGQAIGIELTERDHWICAQVGPTLKQKGLVFVGLDIIGDYLTEINVTSPTCIRELDSLYTTNIAGDLFDCLQSSV